MAERDSLFGGHSEPVDPKVSGRNLLLAHGPNCGCGPCLRASDQLAADGFIPTNDRWWMTQTFFPIGFIGPDGSVL